jgi:signal transduction histidine kinase
MIQIPLTAQSISPKITHFDWLELHLHRPLYKAELMVFFGFFLAMSTVFALTYLFLQRKRIILWYMALSLSLAFSYFTPLTFLYFANSISRFLSYNSVKFAGFGSIICGLKIIYDLTDNHKNNKFNKLFVLGFFGYVISIVGYTQPTPLFYKGSEYVYFICCCIIFVEYFMVIKKGIEQKKIDPNFNKALFLIFLIFASYSAPMLSLDIDLIYYILLTDNILIPLGISIFLALICSKTMKEYEVKQEKIEALIVEKQAILEAQNENLAKQIAEQTSELKNLNTTKDRLFSIIGHDLRSPIASLKGVLLLFNNKQIKQSEFNEMLHYLQKSVDNIYTMLENLLQWSQSQMKEMKPSLKAFEINDVVEQTVELFKEIAIQKKIEVNTDIAKNLIVFADENHVRAIIRNLLNNAIKFTPKNGLISLSGKYKNNFVELQISDSGIGINADDLSTIFTNPKLKRGTEGELGTGLGLVLCKDLIQQNSGEISVKSEALKGTVFQLLIPQKAD